MKVAFFHDSIFIKKDDCYYTSGTLINTLFDFYSNYFDKISIVTRYKEYNTTLNKYITKENLVDNMNVHFNCVNSYFASFRIIKKEVLSNDILIIRCHSFIGVIAAFYARKYKKKYIVESVSCAWDCLWNHSFLGKLAAPIMYVLTKRVIKKAYATTYVSSAFLQKRYPTYGKSLACSDVLLEESIPFSIDKKTQNFHNRTINIANIANLDMKYKGQKYLIKAVYNLINQGYNIKLYLIGGGIGISLKKMVIQLNISKNVVFKGILSHNQIFEILKTIDIYVQPSIAESHGRVILEAMNEGCIVVGSNVGGIPELIEDKNVFKKRSCSELEEILKRIINNDDLKKDYLYSLNKIKEFDKKLLYNKKKDFFDDIMEELKND